ncbi:hypothetical protein [Microcoleus sp. Pol10D4]|uniref:hypothetical protein n=1 Tax=Microcoleus sp. Pol10D4 TaxID=3055387 RepID=UPI002FCF6CEC
MEKLPGLKQLLNEAKEALIVELWQEIQKLSATLATYEPCARAISQKNSSKFRSIDREGISIALASYITISHIYDCTAINQSIFTYAIVTIRTNAIAPLRQSIL